MINNIQAANSSKHSRNTPASLPSAEKAKETVTIDRLLDWAYAGQQVHRGPAWRPTTGFGAALDLSQLGVRVDTNPGGGAKVSNVHVDAETVDRVLELLFDRKVQVLLIQFGITGVEPDPQLNKVHRFWPSRGWIPGSDPVEAVPEYDPTSKRPLFTRVFDINRPEHIADLRQAWVRFDQARFDLGKYFHQNPGELVRFQVAMPKKRRAPWERG